MRRNILLVDDDRDMQELVAFSLEQSGFVVRVLSDGFRVVEELEANHYDVVILDILMPHVNGFKVVKSIRAQSKFKDLPIVMLTGCNDKEDIIKLQKEVDDYIIKPPQKMDLVARLERLLGGRPQFEEVFFDKGDFMAAGSFELPLEVISLSKRGLILFSTVPLKKDFVIRPIRIGLLRELDINHDQFRVVDCVPRKDGGYDCFISFLGLDRQSQQKISEWIMERSFKDRNVG